LSNMTRTDPYATLFQGQTAWIFSDGKAGHESQALGVVEALGLSPEIRRIDLTGIYKFIAPWGPLPSLATTNGGRLRLGPPWPTFAFATGRTIIPYIRALKRRAGLATYTVILMDPRTGPSSADLIWVPAHDRRRGPNVISTLAAPHRLSADRLRALATSMPPSIAGLPRPRIACLIGGPNGDYRYSSEDETRLVETFGRLAASGAGLMITTSRRTPERLATRIKGALPAERAFFWDGSGQNPYPDFVAHADMFVITADSVSMACEAAATGRPIFIFSPSGGGAKSTRFHSGLASHGASRPLPPPGEPLPSWTYEPLHSAEVIAAEITKRWRRRAELLPGLVKAKI